MVILLQRDIKQVNNAKSNYNFISQFVACKELLYPVHNDFNFCTNNNVNCNQIKDIDSYECWSMHNRSPSLYSGFW